MTDSLTDKIIGAAIEVHRILGPGLLESVYEEALCYEFELRGIRFYRQAPVKMHYKDRPIKEHKIDLIVEDRDDRAIVELKSVS
ncbi:MAG: GxxExxY protein [Pirellulales bacterium]|nr:GxxExxY protein [Pirellulales bacterium]